MKTSMKFLFILGVAAVVCESCAERNADIITLTNQQILPGKTKPV